MSKIRKNETIDDLDRKIINKSLDVSDNTDNLRILIGAGWGSAGFIAYLAGLSASTTVISIVPEAFLITLSLLSKKITSNYRKSVNLNNQNTSKPSKNSKLATMFDKAGNVNQ